MATPVDMGETVVRPPAEAQHMTGNEKAATLAVWGGVLMVASGVSGAYQWNQTFEIIEALLGSWRILALAHLVFIGIGSVGGAFVIVGAFCFWKNKVRWGKLMIWLGTGFTILSLIVLVAAQFIRFDWPFAGASLVGFVGIALSVLARFEAHAKRLLP